MEEEEFTEFCMEVGLTSDCLERDILEAHLVQGLSAAELAPRLGLTTPEVEAVLGCGAIRLTVRGGAVGRWEDLLEVMRGGKHSTPATPVYGFDKHHPGDPEYAQEISLRARIVTPHDLAYGERDWRDASPVEAAHRERPAERQRHAKKLRQARVPVGDGERATVAELAARAGLTPREAECLAYAGRGFDYHAIGEELRISPRTAQSYLSRAREKLLAEFGRQSDLEGTPEEPSAPAC